MMVANKLAVAVAAFAAVINMPVAAAEITGAGASFPAPLYAKWGSAYKAATGNTLNYQSIGSGGGQTQIKALQKQIEYDAARIRDHNVCREELAELELRIERSIARQDANHRAELKLDLTLFNQRLNDFIPNPKP